MTRGDVGDQCKLPQVLWDIAVDSPISLHGECDVSKNRFKLESTIGRTFRHASDASERVKINRHNAVHDCNFNTI